MDEGSANGLFLTLRVYLANQFCEERPNQKQELKNC